LCRFRSPRLLLWGGLTNAQRMRYNITATSEFRVAGVGGVCFVSTPTLFLGVGGGLDIFVSGAV